jgi:hypothetical protein
VIGLFLLMNLLLAIFYSNFKMRFERKIESSEDKRSQFLFSEFQKMADGKGYLDKNHTYKMFLLIHELASLTD